MNEIHHIITKVLAQDANVKEQKLLDDWLESKPENQQCFELRCYEWEQMLLFVDVKDKKRVFTNIKERIKVDSGIVKSNRRKSFGWMRIAASIIGLITLGYVSYYELSHPFSHLNLVGYEMIETDAGNQQKMLLADGSLVYLNGDSRLKYRLDSENERKLYLEGEAFFDVARDESKPFIIGLRAGKVEVLGTSFNIKAYPDDDDIATSVITGRVAFEDTEAESLILKPGNKGLINKAENSIVKLNVDNSRDIVWMQRLLIFEKSNLSEMSKELYRMYGVKVTLMDDSLEDLKITAKFDNENINEVFKVLKMTNELSYKIVGDEVMVGVIGRF